MQDDYSYCTCAGAANGAGVDGLWLNSAWGPGCDACCGFGSLLDTVLTMWSQMCIGLSANQLMSFHTFPSPGFAASASDGRPAGYVFDGTCQSGQAGSCEWGTSGTIEATDRLNRFLTFLSLLLCPIHPPPCPSVVLRLVECRSSSVPHSQVAVTRFCIVAGTGHSSKVYNCRLHPQRVLPQCNGQPVCVL